MVPQWARLAFPHLMRPARLACSGGASGELLCPASAMLIGKGADLDVPAVGSTSLASFTSSSAGGGALADKPLGPASAMSIGREADLDVPGVMSSSDDVASFVESSTGAGVDSEGAFGLASFAERSLGFEAASDDPAVGSSNLSSFAPLGPASAMSFDRGADLDVVAVGTSELAGFVVSLTGGGADSDE